MIRTALARCSLALGGAVLAACVGGGPDRPPEVRRAVPGFLFCTPGGYSPLAGTLVDRPLAAAMPYVAAAERAGVVIDIAEIADDGSTLAILIDTPDILTILHRDGMTDTVSCIPRDLCTGPRAPESRLCRGTPG